MNGLLPNMALPITGKIVKHCKNNFSAKDSIEIKISNLITGFSVLNADFNNKEVLTKRRQAAKTKILPAMAIMRNKLLGSCHK